MSEYKQTIEKTKEAIGKLERLLEKYNLKI